jgi:hypothetical protein
MFDQNQNLLPGNLVGVDPSSFDTTIPELFARATIPPTSFETCQDSQQSFWSMLDIPSQDISMHTIQGGTNKRQIDREVPNY